MVVIIPVPARSSQFRPNRGTCPSFGMPGIPCAAFATAEGPGSIQGRVNLEIFIVG